MVVISIIQGTGDPCGAYHDGHGVVHEDEGVAMRVCLYTGEGCNAVHRYRGSDRALVEEKLQHLAVGLRVCEISEDRQRKQSISVGTLVGTEGRWAVTWPSKRKMTQYHPSAEVAILLDVI